MKTKVTTVEHYKVEDKDLDFIRGLRETIEKFCNSSCDDCPFREMCSSNLDPNISLLELFDDLEDAFLMHPEFDKEL